MLCARVTRTDLRITALVARTDAAVAPLLQVSRIHAGRHDRVIKLERPKKKPFNVPPLDAGEPLPNDVFGSLPLGAAV